MRNKKTKLIDEYKTRERELEGWRSDVERMQAVIAQLESEYIAHKRDRFVVRRNRAMKEMIRSATAACRAVDVESVSRRARKLGGLASKYVNDVSADVTPSEQFLLNAERLAAKARLEAMKSDELKEALRRMRDDIHALQQDYRTYLRTMHTLAEAYKTSKRLWFGQRYVARKNMIKATFRHQTRHGMDAAAAVAAAEGVEDKTLGSVWSIFDAIDSDDDSS